ncbi:hyalin-like [Amphiura filiformis]|uniref:hyalin-like n=1 Tax=Amphiura filiformis TaxID=82378 RepID=UPI003B2176D6
MVVWQGPIATDNSGVNPTVMCDPASGTDFIIGKANVTCSALDGFGNVNNCSFYVDIKDNENPVLESCPANQTTNTDPGQPTAMIEWQEPIATDNSGLKPTVMCDPASGTDFVIGKRNVTCTALDGFGNANNCSFYIDIKDNEDPVVASCPANQTTNTDPGQPIAMVVWQGPIATDNSGLNPTVMCEPASGTDFVIGITIVTCTAVDGFGNVNICSFYVDVKDNGDPVLESCPANQTTNTDPGQPTAMIVWQEPIATDNSGLNPTVKCDPASGTDFVIGKTNVTCTALDGFGNANNCSFYVHVKDDWCVNVVHVGPDIQDHSGTLRNGIVFIMPRHVIECVGVVSSWEFWTGVSATFRAMVFRPESGGDPTKWTIVGINDIPASDVIANQRSIYVVPSNDQIAVQIGDVIGVAVGQVSPGIQHFYISGTDLTRYTIMSDPSTLMAGETFVTNHGPTTAEITLAAKISAP